jgi:hypothetical protein
MPIPDPEEQLQFLFKVQRVLSDGLFTASYKFALLLALADLAVERGNDEAKDLSLDTLDLAEKFVALYWRQVLPWVPRGADGRPTRRLAQARGGEAAILNQIANAHDRYQGSLTRLRHDRQDWTRLLAGVGRTIAIMPLWKLQTVGGQKLDFIYPNVGRGGKIQMRGEAVHCFRGFRDIIGDLAQTAWVNFVNGLAKNRPVLGQSADLRQFLFGSDRALLAPFRPFLRDFQNGRCFYCDDRLRGEVAVDHFIPWSRYALDLGHNLVLADCGCNGNKAERLAAFGHLERWCARNETPGFTDQLEKRSLPHDLHRTRRAASWVYDRAERVGAGVWQRGRDELTPLERRWRDLPGMMPPRVRPPTDERKLGRRCAGGIRPR